MSVKETKDEFGFIHKFQEFNGQRFPTVFNGEVIRNVQTAKIREDDVLICGYPRSGTNWTWEMMYMLLRGKADTIPMWKGTEMLEFTSSEEMDTHPSPRVLNTHLHYNNLPKDIHKMQNKIVYVIRNPKDAIVSYYNLYKNVKVDYNGSFEGLLKLHNRNEVHFGSWFSHITDWTNVIQNKLHKDVLIVYYEETIQESNFQTKFDKNMNAGALAIALAYTEEGSYTSNLCRFVDHFILAGKSMVLWTNPLSTIERLAEFIAVQSNPELFSAICEKCEFRRMVKDKKDYTFSVEGEDVMFRKGIVGDWKNWFTVAQSEHFDRLLKEKLPDNELIRRYVQQNVN